MAIGFGSLRTWRRRVVSAPEPVRTIPRWDRVAPNVPAPYLSLYRYLEHRYASTVVLTFDQIETLIGFALPASARSEPDWWSAANATHAHASAWAGAGRSAVPNLPARYVTFDRLA